VRRHGEIDELLLLVDDYKDGQFRLGNSSPRICIELAQLFLDVLLKFLDGVIQGTEISVRPQKRQLSTHVLESSTSSTINILRPIKGRFPSADMSSHCTRTIYHDARVARTEDAETYLGAHFLRFGKAIVFRFGSLGPAQRPHFLV
jgi:hypothetical protein